MYVLQFYATNKPMRSAFLRMNGITHAEVWDTEEGYQIALCSADGIGFPEGPEFGTPGQCVAWLRNTCQCRELAIKN